jgi:small GTP-binding protein
MFLRRTEAEGSGRRRDRSHFSELENREEVDHIFEAKLLLVGEGRVGKTSLMKSLTNPFYKLEDEQSTSGIDIQRWSIPQDRTSFVKEFFFNIWDFGGQEIYHATHQFFLTKRSLYLLVTESLKEDKHEDFYYWLNIIKLLGGDSPVVLVQNKCDQPLKALPIREYQNTFDNLTQAIVQPQVISCHYDYRYTIDSLKQAILRIVTNNDLLPHIGTPLPKVWVVIRKELSNWLEAGKDYISYTEYLELCKKHGMNEERADFLSDFFHDLGVFLHFSNDLHLVDVVFLNHEWVTHGVYNVLDHPRVIGQHGEFTDQDLMDIWREDRYAGKRRELLALMKRFELCYELGNGNYLAPQLLPVDELDYPWRSHENNLYFEFRYKFMPKGLMTRFIVKRHKDIYKSTHWRYGVLLEFENTTYALVRERYFERKITIQLEGDNKRGYLTLIRNTFGEIHESFNNLQVEEMIPCQCNDCKSSNSPHFFSYDLLKRYMTAKRFEIICEKSLQDISITDLIDAAQPGSVRALDRLESESSKKTVVIVGNVHAGAIGDEAQGILKSPQ